MVNMNKRIKKKHRVYNKIYLKQYHRHDEALPIEWFNMCERIRNALRHPICKKRKPLERYFRRNYYWTEKQRVKMWSQFKLKFNLHNNTNDTDFESCFVSTYNGLVNTLVNYRETYEDAVILDYLEEH